MSARCIHTCGTPTKSKLINLQPLSRLQRWCHFPLTDVWPVHHISKFMFNVRKWKLYREAIPHSGIGKKRKKQEIKLLVSELCLMVTDNSNFCKLRLGSFCLHFLRVKKNTIIASTRKTVSHFFIPKHCRLAYLLTAGYPRYSAAHSAFFCTSDDECLFIYLFFLPREIVTCETLYITSKANKIQTHYQLYQELHRRVHTSCYFKTHTFQTEQIKLSPEGGTGMKCLKTAAAFVFRETIVYHLKSINYLYPLLYMNSGLVVYCMRCKT